MRNTTLLPDGMLSEHNQDGTHPGYEPHDTPMNDTTTNRKQFLAMLIIMLAFLAIFSQALYKYDQKHNASAQAVTQARAAVSASTKAINATTAQNKALTTTNATLTATNTELQNEKSHFCTELSKAKVSDPLCTS